MSEVPACPQCAIQPHDEPERPHVHLTDFGYVLFAPNHEMRDYIEEIREFERAAGRRQAAEALRAAPVSGVKIPDWAMPLTGPIIRDLREWAVRIAEGSVSDG